MNNIRVTIGVPIYNVETYIERCVNSLLSQTYSNIEYVFVDDSSPDNSIAILKRTIDQYPKRIKDIKIIKHSKNRGLAAARNTALENATGEYILWVDSDDWLDVQTVAMAINMLRNEKFDIISFGYKKVFPKVVVVGSEPVISDPLQLCLYLLKSGSHQVWGRLIRVSLYRDNNIWVQEGSNMGEDYQVTPRLAFYAKSVATLDKPLYYYNCSNVNSYMASRSKAHVQQLKSSESIIVDFFKDKGEIYLSAIKESESRKYVAFLISKGNVEKNDMNALKELSKYSKCLPFHFRVCYIIRSRYILSIYLSIYKTISRFIKK